MPYWKYGVRGYSGMNHPEYGRGGFGTLILETRQASESSRDMEIEAYRSRNKRNPGEIYKVEVADMVNFKTETIYP